ncbi:hypothetical protein D6817_00640 [Candidatus Pacearchaeota archaeon]|nr:MAG: hypothetical protein D6817_00640 [Candidatus Pacearchaeota archaeon]
MGWQKELLAYTFDVLWDNVSRFGAPYLYSPSLRSSLERIVRASPHYEKLDGNFSEFCELIEQHYLPALKQTLATSRFLLDSEKNLIPREEITRAILVKLERSQNANERA